MFDQNTGIVDGLGQLPAILQAAMIAGVVVGGAVATWLGIAKGMRDKKAARDPYGGGVSLYVDGPIGQALSYLREISESAKRISLAAPELTKLREECAQGIAQNRHWAREEMQRLAAGFDHDKDELDKRLRDIERLAAEHGARLGGLERRRSG